MEREDFIKWLENSEWSREYSNNDDYWNRERDYANCIWDYLEVKNDKVVFIYEDINWGTSYIEKKEYSFDDFIYAAENFELLN